MPDYMQQNKLLFLLFSLSCSLSSAAATVNEPPRLEVSSGYRNDRIHWHLQEPANGSPVTYSELYRDVQFWENALTFKTIYRDLSFFLQGSYAAFGRGTLFQRYADLSYSSAQPQTQFGTTGWAADGTGSFGYAVNLTADRVYKFILIPLFGYSAHFERLNRQNPTPGSFTQGSGADSLSFTSTLPEQLQLTWYGIFVGGSLLIQPAGPLMFAAGYSYHWLHFRIHTGMQNQVQLGNPVTSQFEQTLSIPSKKAGNHGQSGWAQMDYLLTRFWRLGLGARIHYFSSSFYEVKQQEETTTQLPLISSSSTQVPQTLKMRWTSIAGWVQASRAF